MTDLKAPCPDCGGPMTEVPGVEWYCENPACVEKMVKGFRAMFRNRPRRFSPEEFRALVAAKDARISELEKALAPFAKIPQSIIGPDEEIMHYWVVNGSPAKSSFTRCDLSAARKALKGEA
jgi:hypothetical protein